MPAYLKTIFGAVVLLLVALSPFHSFTPACAAEDRRVPEQLLPPTTQAYARWDGIAAHKDAYANSARGKMLAGETSKLCEHLLEQLHRKAKLDLVGEPLLQGNLPADLRNARADIQLLRRLPEMLGETGIVAGFEMRPLGGLPPTALQVQLTLILPGAAEKPELLAAMRLLKRKAKSSVKEQVILNRKVTVIGDRSGNLAAWAEGKHFVFTFSDHPVEKVVQRIKEAGAGITENLLFQKLAGFKEFRVVTRGFINNIDADSDRLLRASVPELWAVGEELGLTSIKSACFWDGFDGEESRGVIEIDFTGERRGITRLFRPMKTRSGAATPSRPAPLRAEDLPPLPADLTRFTAARLDLGAFYDLIHVTYRGQHFLAKLGDPPFSPEERLKKHGEELKKHKEQLSQLIDQEAGFKMAELFAALDDKVVMYQAPSDGILILSQVVAVGVKDEKAVQRCLEGLIRKLETAPRAEMVVKKRDCLGVEVHEFVVKGNSPLTPSCAICNGWLVIGFHPQPVRGFIHRSKGKLPAWKPDARTAATLAKVPADRCVIQVADPRPTLQWVLGAAPLIVGLIGERNSEPSLSPGLIPHSGEVCHHLFPNVMWCRDDGKTMRWESRDSLWLPFESVGMEVISMFATFIPRITYFF